MHGADGDGGVFAGVSFEGEGDSCGGGSAGQEVGVYFVAELWGELGEEESWWGGGGCHGCDFF